ncbi:ABC transporter ATP-binding protein [Gryllotalpicola reticulitermitis]|uniref:ABC transporter ATP-binding protein n=1 Tax=Gryllotalpicola reticulitermitis TaxID=1184153 RepID=A0ABV8Q5U6_9MICO
MLIALLRRYLGPRWRLLVGVLVFQLAQSLAALYLPTLNADIINNGVAKGDTGYIVRIGGWMLLVTLAQVACSITAVYFGARAAMGLGRDVRLAVFTKVGEFSEREVQLFGAPSLITRSTNDVQQVQMLVLMSCTMMVSAPITAVGGVILAIQQDGRLSWIIAVAVPVLLICVSAVVSRMVPWFRKMQGRIDAVNRVLREQLTGIRVVRAFVREDIETDRFEKVNADVMEAGLNAGRWMTTMFPIVMLILNLASVAVIWFGAFRVQDGMPIGALTAFLSYLVQILMAVMMATFMAVMVPRAAVSATRISEVLDTDPSISTPRAPVEHLEESGTIELAGVGFHYPGAEQPVLTDVSFRVGRGETVAIIGSTGAGKTTLVNLLPRLFDATAGAVYVDGVDVATLDPELLWSRIGLVPQKPYLFSGTVATNLRYGKPDATEEELWRALEIAQAADFVREMDGGLDAVIAQGGTSVSGGQRQRLAIARALVKRPEIYVFDDSFSALDLATDARLRAALRREEGTASFVIVAQRVSTIVDADRIVVLEDGRVVGIGTHEELREGNATYAEIVESQLAVQEAR